MPARASPRTASVIKRQLLPLDSLLRDRRDVSLRAGQSVHANDGCLWVGKKAKDLDRLT
jgi:hypothetical protein